MFTVIGNNKTAATRPPSKPLAIHDSSDYFHRFQTAVDELGPGFIKKIFMSFPSTLFKKLKSVCTPEQLNNVYIIPTAGMKFLNISSTMDEMLDELLKISIVCMFMNDMDMFYVNMCVNEAIQDFKKSCVFNFYTHPTEDTIDALADHVSDYAFGGEKLSKARALDTWNGVELGYSVNSYVFAETTFDYKCNQTIVKMVIPEEDENNSPHFLKRAMPIMQVSVHDANSKIAEILREDFELGSTQFGVYGITFTMMMPKLMMKIFELEGKDPKVFEKLL
jgi:hypothetical protein